MSALAVILGIAFGVAVPAALFAFIDWASHPARRWPNVWRGACRLADDIAAKNDA